MSNEIVFDIEADGFIFEVVTMDGHKIDKVHIIPQLDAKAEH